MTTDPNRLREHPAERLAGAASRFDLAEELCTLRAEPIDPAHPTHGHRQKVLARHGGATVAVFAFEAGGALPPHTTRGTVVIQALEGDLVVEADGARHPLPAGSVAVLSPGTRHAVQAATRSAMLLTVSLQT